MTRLWPSWPGLAFDQVVLAQALEITAAHANTDSALVEPRKPALHLGPHHPALVASRHPVGRYHPDTTML